MRKSSISQEEYDAITKSSCGCKFEGVIERYWKYHHGRYYPTISLRVNNGGQINSFQHLELLIGKHACAGLPAGTKVTIDIPPGVTPPCNFFNDKPMEFQAESEPLWINDNACPGDQC